MPVDPFDQWFAKYLGTNAREITCLLGDKTAIRFLIAWSIFETSCFGGFAKDNDIEDFVKGLVGTKGFQPSELMDAAKHFHERYQDKTLYRHLIYVKKSYPQLESIRHKDFTSLSDFELVYFVIFVVYRYRNNIFHGNKGVASWLEFRPQIKLCIKVMQVFITAVDALRKAAKQGDANAQEALSKLGVDWKK